MQAITAPEIEHAVQDWLKYNTDPELRPALVRELHHIRSYNTDIHYAKQEGREQGLQQGEQNKQREIAKAMLKAGEPPEKILSYTGLTPDQLA